MNKLGRYYPTHSFWHNLDPRAIIAVVVSIIILLMLTQGIALIYSIVLVLLLYMTAKLPMRLVVEILNKFKWFLLITLLANLFFSGILSIAVLKAIVKTIRLGGLFLVAMWLSFVTRPGTLVEGVKRLLKPLTVFKISVFDISIVMTLVLRFIPELLEESENIIIAQKIRGVKPKLTWKCSGAWIQSTFIPIFISSIRKSTAMAMAMEARGFRPGAPRSSMEELRLAVKDYLILGLSVGLILCLLIYKYLL